MRITTSTHNISGHIPTPLRRVANFFGLGRSADAPYRSSFHEQPPTRFAIFFKRSDRTTTFGNNNASDATQRHDINNYSNTPITQNLSPSPHVVPNQIPDRLGILMYGRNQMTATASNSRSEPQTRPETNSYARHSTTREKSRLKEAEKDSRNAEQISRWKAWAQEPAAPGEKRGEAVKRMEAWLHANDCSKVLTLRDLGLTEPPEDLPEKLVELDISQNKLTSLSKKLPNSLRVLNAASNDLASVPENLPTALRELNIGGNKVTSLSNLPDGLRELRAYSNELTSIPDDLPASLTSLDVDGNQLTSLSESLPNALKYLRASQNKLTTLPDTWPASLKYLSVGYNQLNTLSETLPDSLEDLKAPTNQLVKLPERLPAKLQSLIVSHNQLSYWPKNMPQSLVYVHADLNKLNSYPEGLRADTEIVIRSKWS